VNRYSITSTFPLPPPSSIVRPGSASLPFGVDLISILSFINTTYAFTPDGPFPSSLSNVSFGSLAKDWDLEGDCALGTTVMLSALKSAVGVTEVRKVTRHGSRAVSILDIIMPV